MLDEVILGDCLEVMAALPDNSVDLICSDPPYFAVKKPKGGREGELDSWWDNQWDKPAEFLKWLDRVAEQWQRILKPNGSLYCFASPKMAARVEVMLGDRFNVINRITWQKPPYSTKAEMFVKEDLRGFFPASEAIIFCEHHGSNNFAKGEAGYGAKCDELRGFVFEPLRLYLISEMQRASINPAIIRQKLGYTSNLAHNWFSVSGSSGAISAWVLPLADQYMKLQQAFPGYFTRPYEQLKQQYEELRRPFSVSADVPYTDVWTFPTVQAYPGKHKCEKPLSLLSHIISASSRPGAVVLDSFAGSGATLVAAKQLDRRFIGIEIDPHWVNVARQRLGQFDSKTLTLEERVQWLETQVKANTRKIKKLESDNGQLSLFSA